MFVEIQRFKGLLCKSYLVSRWVTHVAVMIFIQNLITFSVLVMWISPFLNKSCGNAQVCVKEKFQIWIGFKMHLFDGMPNFVICHLAFIAVNYHAYSHVNFRVL